MPLIAVDVGNSSIKYFVASAGDANGTSSTECVNLTLPELENGGLPLEQPGQWFVSSVNQDNLEMLRRTAERAGQVDSWHEIRRHEVPLTIDLLEPQTVGIDRILAALAAHRLYGSGHDTIVVDCGTALTIDLVDRNATFRGGVIMAGPATHLLALNSMTAALPDLSTEKLRMPESVIGRSTRDAMLNGAWFSGLGAIREVVSAMQEKCQGDAVVVGTGGGLGPWRDVLPAEWVLVNDLVLDGILQVASELPRESIHEPG